MEIIQEILWMDIIALYAQVIKLFFDWDYMSEITMSDRMRMCIVINNVSLK